MATNDQEPVVSTPSTIATETEPEALSQPVTVSATPMGEPVLQAEPFALLNEMNEAINGRAAMVGFVGIVIGEIISGQSAWSQVAGKFVNEKWVEKALFVSDLGFFRSYCVVVICFFSSQAYC
eukprot:TRINITY_DN7527_c0_g1_i3.p3 TRINITY_DN7527_c0_g1~~TRINITY_DN7527_c0_g1_i3.p3  ORF type:complete len:123 (-),score=12.12 TRINITY_DN7527_c0_g1_i3:378-746(-)